MVVVVVMLYFGAVSFNTTGPQFEHKPKFTP
jgi:hypothetical protein